MGRIIQMSLTATPKALDLKQPSAGKLWIYISGSNDVRIAYDPAAADGTQYFTLLAGSQYLLDQSSQMGFLAQNELLYLRSAPSTSSVQVWVSWANA